MRLLLVLTLIHGLAPSLGELAEAAVHFVVEGHLAHSQAANCELGERGDEHGCGTTEHHCACCASQVFMASAAVAERATAPRVSPAVMVRARLVSLHEPAPPWRPPIAG